MKALFYSIVILSITLVSCSKNNTPTPKQSVNTVNIEGKDYNTVVIGNQTWTTVNYDGPGGIKGPNLDESIYGKFYTIAESQVITLPTGWRMPTQSDFTALMKTQGAVDIGTDGKITLTATTSHLRSLSAWFTSLAGDNKSGFNAQPGGFGYVDHNYFLNQKGTAYFLSSTPDPNRANSNRYFVIECALGLSSVVVDDAYIDPTEYLINASFTLRFVKDN